MRKGRHEYVRLARQVVALNQKMQALLTPLGTEEAGLVRDIVSEINQSQEPPKPRKRRKTTAKGKKDAKGTKAKGTKVPTVKATPRFRPRKPEGETRTAVPVKTESLDDE